MGKIIQNISCYFFDKSRTQELKESLGEAYAEAYQKGYSVVEIARAAGSKSCKYIHTHLVKLGMIGRAKSDAEHNCYRCTVDGFDFVGYGNNPSGALSVGLWWYRGAETIRRLKMLPDIREERVGW